MKAPKESDLIRAVLQLLKLRGVPAFRNNTGCGTFAGKGSRKRFVRFGVPGGADVLGVLPRRADGSRGVFLAVECKMPGGRLRPEQAAFLDAVRAAGGLAMVVHSLDELIMALALESVPPDAAAR